MRDVRGFTMIEMVTVIILVGILAAVAIPRMETTLFKERGFRDGVFATLAHARQVAIASRRFVCVTITAGSGSSAGLAVTRDVGLNPESASSINCTQAVALPTQSMGCAANALCAPAGVSLSGAGSIVFDPQGRSVSAPNTPVAATISVSNQNDVTVAAETGFVQ